MGRRRAETQRRGRVEARTSEDPSSPPPAASSSPSDQISQLSDRIDRLERALSAALRPLEAMGEAGNRYLRLASLLLEHGGLSPDTLFPEVKDPISRDILSTLMRLREANISRLTDELRDRRGRASRRIVRERLHSLEEGGYVEAVERGRRPLYSLTERVVRKWSSLFTSEK